MRTHAYCVIGGNEYRSLCGSRRHWKMLYRPNAVTTCLRCLAVLKARASRIQKLDRKNGRAV